MTQAQILIFLILAATMAMFLWGRVRYDMVALLALVIGVIAGVVPTDMAFSGFGNPAVITVAAVLVISRALQMSGLIDRIATLITNRARTEFAQVSALSALAAALSAFMNNIGALALVMPVVMRVAERPSRLLMPISFASILGGLITLIGTPPNIIIASFRGTVSDEPFAMFDFAMVGLPVAFVGVLYITLIGWRLVPQNRDGRKSAEDLFEIRDYIAEAKVAAGSNLVGEPITALEQLAGGELLVVGLIRDNQRQLADLRRVSLREDDIVLLRADATVLERLHTEAGLETLTDPDLNEAMLRSDKIGLIEAVVPPGARIEGLTPNYLRLRRRYGVALLALARQGGAIVHRIGTTHLRAGDVLLLQGAIEDLPDIVHRLGCLPLASRGLGARRPGQVLVPLAIFGLSVLATAFGLLPAHIAFVAAVVALILLNRIGPAQAYDSIDMPVIVMLGAMIPLGRALQDTGATELIAGGIISVASQVPPIVVLALLLVVTMALTDIINNAATAIVMAPIGASIATRLGVSVDPFLMAVAIGASCAFLTPIGHQNNVVVMGPGGYRFGDYWRMGLPLDALIVVTAVPLIAVVWPM
ncbi:MAG: SLC13 family permease [Alphaproteobacteria bacterium]